MNTFTAYSSNSQIYKIEDNHQSNLPKAKLATVALFVFTLSSAGIITNQNHSSLNFSTKNKRETIKVSNDTDSNTNAFTFENKKGDDDMPEKTTATEIKLNEVEKYFNEKISDIKDTVHVIDKKSSVIENELHHINGKISEMNSKFDSIPDMIKETITNTLNEKAVNKKQSFISDYKAPVITGLIVAVLTPIVMLVAAKILGLLH